MVDYREEQRLNQILVQNYFTRQGEVERRLILDKCQDYLQFRDELSRFQGRHFQSLCNAACFQQQRSACCSKDGIITFFADLVINAAVSTPAEVNELITSLEKPRDDMKCIYLDPQGCRWRMKPIVCEMFICDQAKQKVFETVVGAEATWEEMKRKELTFRWPDHPVLFDEIESRFMAAGVRSSLMYLHVSPGLIRIKRKAGLM